MKIQPIERWDRETTLVSQIAAGISLLAFLVYFRRSDLLLYGDAVAHINIARRVVDSQTPGLLQLGTVWLPLPHLLMIPFLLSSVSWQTGIGGSIPSMCAYVFAVVGIFRLVRGSLSVHSEPSGTVRIVAWLSAAIFAGNPNLIYLGTTAMTELLYLALFVWVVVHCCEFVQAAVGPQADNDMAAKSLLKCGLCLAASCLTRYDGWFLAGATCLVAVIVVLQSPIRQSLGRSVAQLFLLAAVAPVLWLGYNAAIYRNALEFANGPYSARAIEQRSATPGMPGHPGAHDPPAAFSYFLKSAELNLAEGQLERPWVLVLLAGVPLLLIVNRHLWPFVLLMVPIPFYMFSIAYGGVPIFLPEWWPFSYYNLRYGVQLIPMAAVSLALATYLLLNLARNTSAKVAGIVIPILFVAASYTSVWRAQPVTYREAAVNSRSRIALETELASTLVRLPHDSTLLMYLGDHVGALERAGIPFRRVINEGNHRPWRKPSDPAGLWERALADPQRYADYVIAMDNDPVATAVNRRDLASMVRIRTTGQPAATVYWTHRVAR